MNKPHSFTKKLKRCPWFYCAYCGLLLLSNEATKKAANKPCRGWEEE